MTVTLCLSRSLVLMWLSLQHFVYNSVRSSTQLPGTILATAPLAVELNWNQNSIQLARRTQMNYIIVRRPLDLWNWMFNRHQAEITVMQLRGHSLPVHHSVVHHGNYLVPFHQPISAHAFSSPNCYWNVSLPCGASPWNSISLGQVEGQNITHEGATFGICLRQKLPDEPIFL